MAENKLSGWGNFLTGGITFLVSCCNNCHTIWKFMGKKHDSKSKKLYHNIKQQLEHSSFEEKTQKSSKNIIFLVTSFVCFGV